MFRHPKRSSSKAVMPLRPLDTLKEVASSVNMLDEQNEQQMGYRTSHLRSNISHSGHQTSNLPYGSSRNYSNKDCEGGEQQSWPSPHTWVQKPQNDVQQPLMRRPRWSTGMDAVNAAGLLLPVEEITQLWSKLKHLHWREREEFTPC